MEADIAVDERAELEPLRLILEEEIRLARAELRRPSHGLLISGLTAGFSVGFSVLALAVWNTMSREFSSDPLVAIVSANFYAIGFIIVAGWLMGVLSWLVAASRETASQLLVIWIVAALIGFGHLHHSILARWRS